MVKGATIALGLGLIAVGGCALFSEYFASSGPETFCSPQNLGSHVVSADGTTVEIYERGQDRVTLDTETGQAWSYDNGTVMGMDTDMFPTIELKAQLEECPGLEDIIRVNDLNNGQFLVEIHRRNKEG